MKTKDCQNSIRERIFNVAVIVFALYILFGWGVLSVVLLAVTGGAEWAGWFTVVNSAIVAFILAWVILGE